MVWLIVWYDFILYIYLKPATVRDRPRFHAVHIPFVPPPEGLEVCHLLCANDPKLLCQLFSLI